MIIPAEQLAGVKLGPREKLIVDRLQQGPATRKELGALISHDGQTYRSNAVKVSTYLGNIRWKLKPIGWTVPKHEGGNRYIERLFELKRLP